MDGPREQVPCSPSLPHLSPPHALGGISRSFYQTSFYKNRGRPGQPYQVKLPG